MKRVLDSGILRVVIALVLVIFLIAGGWLSELNPIFLQIFVALIPASGAIIAAYISRSQAQKKRNSKVRSARVKGYSKTENELLKMYQSKLRGDPRIAHVKILDMNRLLEIKNIYVQVKIHQETRLTFEPDATFHDSAFRIESDPTRILKANRSRIESRANVALDAIGVIGKNKHCVIVGDPGTGKTTLLKYLTLKSIRAIKEQTSNQSTLPIFPIYIELNAFASSGHEKLLEYAASLWNKRYNIAASYDVIMPLIEHRLAEGEALILLDGLDETLMGGTKEEAEKKYSRVVDAITNLSTSYTESSIVVTVRKAVYYQQKRRLDGFTEYEMQEFRSEDIKQLVHNWFAATPDPQRPCNAYDLLDRLEHNPRMQALAANPLLLSLIIIVYEAQLDLPDRRSELYKQCVITLLNDWDKHRGISRYSEFKSEHKKHLLEEVSWHFYLQGQYYFPEDDLLTEIAKFLPEKNRLILEEITTEHGLLKEQVTGLFGFMHLTLQEYFVAQYAINHNLEDMVMAHRWDPRWEEVILLYAGAITDVTPLLHKLLDQTKDGPWQEDIFSTNLILAGRCLATRPTFPKIAMRDFVLSQLFDRLKRTKHSLTRTRIADALIEIGGTDVINNLLALFFNKQVNAVIRQSITEALCNQGGQSIAFYLLQRLADSQNDPVTCQTIATVLGRQREFSVARDLLRLFKDRQIVQNADVRLSIIEALGIMGESSIGHELLELLSTESEPPIREGIVYALGMLGDKSLANDLLERLKHEENDSMRRSIAEAIGSLGDRGAARELLGLLSTEREAPVREAIIYALGILGEKTVANDLLQRLASPIESAYVRQSLATALGMLGEIRLVPGLRQLFSQETDPSVRCCIAAALAKLGDQSIVPELLRLLFSGQTDRIVCSRIADALSTTGKPSSLLEILRNLANSQIDASVCALLKQLANSQIDSGVRNRIVTVLWEMDTKQAVHELLVFLSNRQLNPYMREHIAIVLEQLADDEGSVDALIKLLEGSDIVDRIHHTLWTICRRAGITIIRDSYSPRKDLKIVRWGNAITLQDTMILPQTPQVFPLSGQNRVPTVVMMGTTKLLRNSYTH